LQLFFLIVVTYILHYLISHLCKSNWDISKCEFTSHNCDYFNKKKCLIITTSITQWLYFLF